MALELSPEGTRAVASLLDPVRNTRDLWIYDILRGKRTRLTFDPADEFDAIWSPDGSRIVFDRDRKGATRVVSEGREWGWRRRGSAVGRSSECVCEQLVVRRPVHSL